MKRSFAWVPLLMIVACGVVVGAQATLSNEDHPKLMKANAQAAGAMNKAIGSGAFADARTQVATLRQNFTSLQGFWMGKKKEDAVLIIKDGLTRLDALDKLSRPQPSTRWRCRPLPKSSVATPAPHATSSIERAMPNRASDSRQVCCRRCTQRGTK